MMFSKTVTMIEAKLSTGLSPVASTTGSASGCCCRAQFIQSKPGTWS